MSRRSFTVNFTGDVMLGRLIDQLLPSHVHEPSEQSIVRSFKNSTPALANYGPKSPWGDTLSLFQESDLNIINLETAVTTHSRKWPDKTFNYRMHPANIESLRVARVHYVGLANNHSLDFCEEGLAETVQTVKAAGIAYAGAGLDREEAVWPAVLSLDDHRVCIWAASDHPREWSAVPAFNLIDYSVKTKERLKDVIRRTTPTDASLKVFSCHWGPNYSWQPARQIQDLAHFLVDECGIDFIHGHSSHHVQGVEVYKGKLIVYGCVDFVDDYAVVKEFRNDLSGVWRVFLEEEEENGRKLRAKRLEFRPTKIDRFMARQLQPNEPDSSWVRDKVVQLSADFGTKARVDDEAGIVVVDLDQI